MNEGKIISICTYIFQIKKESMLLKTKEMKEGILHSNIRVYSFFALNYILGCEITVANCKSEKVTEKILETWLSIFLGVNVNCCEKTKKS